MAASQSSRGKSEERGGEYGVNGNAASIHAQLRVGCSAPPRALPPVRTTLKQHLSHTWPISAQPFVLPCSWRDVSPRTAVYLSRQPSPPRCHPCARPFPCSDRSGHAFYCATASSPLRHLPLHQAQLCPVILPPRRAGLAVCDPTPVEGALPACPNPFCHVPPKSSLPRPTRTRAHTCVHARTHAH